MSLLPGADGNVSMASLNSGVTDNTAIFRRCLCFELKRDVQQKGPNAFSFVSYKRDGENLVPTAQQLSFTQLISLLEAMDANVSASDPLEGFDPDFDPVLFPEITTTATLYNNDPDGIKSTARKRAFAMNSQGIITPEQLVASLGRKKGLSSDTAYSDIALEITQVGEPKETAILAEQIVEPHPMSIHLESSFH